MTPNPHPETITDEATGQVIPSQRYQDWESGHAVGHSAGIREGMESSDRVHNALHRIALKFLKAGNPAHSTYEYIREFNEERSKTISLLEAAVEGK